MLDADPPVRPFDVRGVADHVAAGRQAEVGVVQFGQQAGRPARPPTPSPPRSGRGGGARRSSGSVMENAPPDCSSACRPSASTSATSGGHWSRSISPRSSRLIIESSRYVLKIRSTSRSWATTAVQARRPADVSRVPTAQRQAHRHPHHVLDPPTDAGGGAGSALDPSGLDVGGHIPASSSAACSDCRYPSLVTVAPLTMSMFALCAPIVSCTRIGSAYALIC